MDKIKLVGAVHLFLIHKEQVLLLRRFNTGYQDGNYSVPAGHMQSGEPVKVAMMREAFEECGISLDPHHLKIVGVMHRQSKEARIDFFLATDHWKGHIRNCEPDKCDELRWFALSRLPSNTVAYVRKALQNYQGSQWFDEYDEISHACDLSNES